MYVFGIFFNQIELILDFQKTETKKNQKITSTDKSHNQTNKTVTTTTTIESSSKTSVTHSKCTVQEGVRMMVTPGMFGTPSAALEKAIINPPPVVQKSVIVTQDSASKMFASIANSQLKTLGAVATVCNPILAQAKGEEILVTSKPPLATRSNGNLKVTLVYV